MKFVGPTANKGFARFNAWFTSRGGVYQTVSATLLLVALENFGVVRDPHGFFLLYWLTVYSAITQPALAAAARTNEEQLEAVLHKMRQADENSAVLLARVVALLEAKDA